ncbi:MAG TPA: metallophosphatase [Chryseosolibacter sp.]|nr:metallophosphatase [Chryseosolibacter sp.]
MNIGSKSNRRKFLIQAGAIGAMATMPGFLFGKTEGKKLTILHTNDTHSRIDPFPDNDPNYAGQGGVARRAALINKIRTAEKNVLLLDSGDIYQGTPYFNVFKGSLEIKLMSQMGYDAATMGNHDFDLGLEGFLANLPEARFPFLCSNYDFTNTILEGRTEPFRVFERDGLRIGVFGIGVKLQDLVLPKLSAETKYLDPVETSLDMARKLRNDHRCDLVICLSHIGYQFRNPDYMNDIRLATLTENVDIILGGHSHHFLDQPDVKLNRREKQVLIAQTGHGGIRLGRIDVYFDEKRKVTGHTALLEKVGPWRDA